MTLVEFLLARIGEDELTAQLAIQTRRPEWLLVEDVADGVDRVVEAGGALICSPSEQEMSDHIVRWDPARVLAECDAKRVVIDVGLGHAASIDGEWGCCHPVTSIRAELVLADEEYGEVNHVLTPDSCDGVREAWAALGPLAAPYADHPDFDRAWRTE